MDNDILQKFKEQDEKLDKIWKSVEKTRKLFLIVVWITVITFVIPLMISVFVIPSFLHSYLGSFGGL